MRRATAFLLIFACALPALAGGPDPKALSSYAFDAGRPYPRLGTIPPWLLELWARQDEAPYEAYSPTPEEAKVVQAAFDGLPDPMKKAMSERLIAVYLVKGLKGNGITDWTLDASSRPFVYMILNSAGLSQSLSQLMTERDRSAFRGPAEIAVEAGDGPGILYSVAHESAHAFDYVRGVTPFTEPGLYAALHPGREAPKSWDVWADYGKPKAGSDYPLRSKFRFYGFGDPELEPAQAGQACAQWAASPFASFYGSRSWAEDLAELFVLRHLSEDLGGKLVRRCDGKEYRPWDSPKVRSRAMRLLEPLYR